MRGLPPNSVHMSISSPPFGSLYSYTDALQDMSNVRTDTEFFAGMEFMVAELERVVMPGRIVAFHCMNLPSTIERDGFIGIRDFRGDLIRLYQKYGFIYHSEVVIWKDPLIAATRTHAIGLAHKQIVQDSSICRTGIPDYLIAMRKPGKNPEPVTHQPSGFDRYVGDPKNEPKREKKKDPGKNKYSHEVWQRYASPVWFDIDPSDTLQRESAREDDDSRHICPLQLTVIRRAIELWSNPGDVVFWNNWSPRLGANIKFDSAGKTIGDLVAAQGRATTETLAKNGCPVRTIHIDELDEASLGELLMHFMLETIIAAHLLGVDPFDQPAVEEGKVLAKKHLIGGG